MEQNFLPSGPVENILQRIVRPRDRKLALFYFAEKENYTF